MRRFPLLVLAMLLLTALTVSSACQRPVDPTDCLDSADSIMETDPDSALSVLCGITPDMLNDDATRARHALLLSLSLVKCGYTPDNDSVPRVALDYYTRTGDKTNRMKALYFMGDVADNRREHVEAMTYLLMAQAIADETHDSYWFAKISELMGDISFSSYNFNEAARYSLTAARFYKKAGKELNHRYDLVDYARALCRLEKYHESLGTIDSIYNIASASPQDSSLMRYCIKAKFNTLMASGSGEEAKKLFDDNIDWAYNSLHSCGIITDIGLYYLQQGNLEDARNYLNCADSLAADNIDRLYLDNAWSQYYTETGNLSKAKSLLEDVLKRQNNAIDTLLRESIVTAQ